MTKAPSSLQDLRRSLYVKAKAEPAWRFWGLYVHVCKMETLQEAYRMAKENDGAPGIDGVTFETIEESGVEGFLRQIRDELITNTYRPMIASASAEGTRWQRSAPGKARRFWKCGSRHLLYFSDGFCFLCHNLLGQRSIIERGYHHLAVL